MTWLLMLSHCTMTYPIHPASQYCTAMRRHCIFVILSVHINSITSSLLFDSNINLRKRDSANLGFKKKDEQTKSLNDLFGFTFVICVSFPQIIPVVSPLSLVSLSLKHFWPLNMLVCERMLWARYPRKASEEVADGPDSESDLVVALMVVESRRRRRRLGVASHRGDTEWLRRRKRRREKWKKVRGRCVGVMLGDMKQTDSCRKGHAKWKQGLWQLWGHGMHAYQTQLHPFLLKGNIHT